MTVPQGRWFKIIIVSIVKVCRPPPSGLLSRRSGRMGGGFPGRGLDDSSPRHWGGRFGRGGEGRQLSVDLIKVGRSPDGDLFIATRRCRLSERMRDASPLPYILAKR